MRTCQICTKPVIRRHIVAVIEPVSFALGESESRPLHVKAHELTTCSPECYAAACCVVEFIRDVGRRFCENTRRDVNTEYATCCKYGLTGLAQELCSSWDRRMKEANDIQFQTRMHGMSHADVSHDLERQLLWAAKQSAK